MTAPDVLAIQRWYPLIYFACHREHVRGSSARHGLTERESSILAHLDRRRACGAGALAEHLGIRASTLSALIKSLAARGLLAATRDAADRRQLQLRLTAAGEDTMSGSSVLDATRVATLLARLSPAQRRDAVRGLRLLGSAARALDRKESR